MASTKIGRRVTIYDVAKRAGVSPMTVSRVINSGAYHARVAEDTRERVLRAIKDIGYHPQSSARALALARTETIAFALYDVDYILAPYFATIFIGAAHAAALNHYNLQLTTTLLPSGSHERGLNLLRLAEERRVDGLVILDEDLRDDEILMIEAAGMQIVLVDRPAPTGSSSLVVGVDNARGIYLAVRHHVELGHRHIGFLTGPLHFARDRQLLKDCRAALEALGLDPNSLSVWSTETGTQESIDGIVMGCNDLPTAFVTTTDEMAMSLIIALSKRRLVVPQDVSVIGYGGYWDAIPLSQVMPPLTTIDVPQREMGELSVNVLVQALKEEQYPQAVTLLQPKLSVNLTTAPPSR